MENSTLRRPAPPAGFEYEDAAAPAAPSATAAPAAAPNVLKRPAPPPGFSYDAPAAAPTLVKPETGDFMRGFKTSAHQLPQLAGGALAFGGDVLSRTGKALGTDGATGDAVADYGLDVYKKHEADTQALSKPSDSFTHVLKHPRELGSFLKYTTGYVGGQAAESLAAMGVGALAGSELPGAGNVAGAVTGLVARPWLERQVLKKTAELIAEKGMAKEAAEQAAGAAVKKQLGRAAGATAASLGMNETQELGSIYGEARDQASDEGRTLTGGDLARVGGASVAAAGVDTLADMLNVGSVAKGVKAPVADVGKSVLRQRLAAGGKEALKDATREGATEAAQTMIERYGAGQSLNDAEALQDVVDSTAAGVVGGAGAGSVAALHTQKAPAANAEPTADAPVEAPAAQPVQAADVPNPGAAPGSLSDVANVLAKPAGPMERTAQAAAEQGVVAPTAAAPAPAAPVVDQPPVAAPMAATPAPEAASPAAPIAVALPWVNTETGEVGKPTKGQLTSAVADYVTQLFATQGQMRFNNGDLADQWGVPKADIARVRNRATHLAADQVRATEGLAATPAAAAAADTTRPVSPREAVASAETRQTTADSTDSAPPSAPQDPDGIPSGAAVSAPLLDPERAAEEDSIAGPSGDHATGAPTDERVPSPAPVAADDADTATAGAADAQPAAIVDNGTTEDAAEPAPAVRADLPGGSATADAQPALTPAPPAEEPVAAKPAARAPKAAAAPTGNGSSAATTITPPADPVSGALRSIADGQHPEKALGAPDDATVRAVAKAMGRTFSPKASTTAIVERLGEQAASDWRAQAKAAVQKLAPVNVPAATTITPAAPASPVGHTVSAAARDAEGMRVKTAAGEINGRSHVDSLVGSGFTKVESTRAGDKLVHSLVSADGRREPIKARQLKYAKEATARHAETARQQIEAAAHEAATSPQNALPEPTQAQKEAGNYKLGHVQVHGLDVSIENPRGSTRSGVGENGKPWSHVMSDHYGYVRGTVGADGDHVDVYVGPKHDAPRVFVVDQIDQKTGKFDEHKAMLGFADQGAAVRAYRANFDKGWKVGPVKDMTAEQFKTWLKAGDTTGPATAAQPVVNQQLTTEPGEPATGKDSLKVAAKTATAPIEDFGETLHGARKHYAEEYAARLNEGLKLDLATEPLSKTWPEPDYAKAIETGTAPEVASWVHAARDEIPSRPVKGWKKRGWVEAVTALRQLSTDLMSGKISYDELQQKLAQPEYKGLREKIGGRAELYDAVGHDVSLKGVTMAEHHYALYTGEKNVTKWVVEKKAKATGYSNWPTELGVADTKAEAIKAFKKNLDALAPKPKAAKAAALIIYSRRSQKKFFIGVKVRGNAIDLHATDTAKEAREYLDAHRDELAALVAKMKEVPNERNASNAPRIGIDHRAGANVKPEQFGDAFGFRGVQFGNYVEGPRRQADLNNAYDALMDLAGVLDIPPRALSLNGTLGLAFGARGHGGKNAPAAHYEPNNIVINLTKSAGAGSLAHEWWHGLDNYFASLREGSEKKLRSNNYLTEQAKGQPIPGVRDEMANAFQRVANTINDTGLRERSKNLDKLKTKDYWSTGREMSARSFENYVIAKLADQGAANDYLANIVSEKTFGTDHDYPYLKAGEIPAVRAAYDDFFHTVQTKDGADGKVALFSRDADAASDEPFYSALNRSVDTAKGAPKAGDATAWKQWMDGAQHRGEFKQAEREWLGVDQWLADQKGKVTREQLQAFVRDNQVQVQETELGKSRNQLYDEQNRLEQKMHAKYGDGWMDKATAAERKQYADLGDQAEGPNLATKFAGYQLPGGSNYKELLLTLPEVKTTKPYKQWLAENFTGKDTAEARSLYAEQREPGKNYQSNHFDQPNILAHVRFNERTDADGKKVLFLEEVQSDWHQAGRRSGYAGDPAAARFDTREKAEAANRRVGGTGVVQVGDQFSFIPKQTDRVPNAPLKKEWPMLAIKRMVRYAAENGFDRIAWTTGEQQAARYDLSKQVDAVRVSPSSKPGQVHVMVRRQGGGEFERVGDVSAVPHDKLADTIGKDLAEKALKDIEDGAAHDYTGVDLKVGGEGMQAFYDRILPNEVNKWAKPFGGKVGESSIEVPGGEVMTRQDQGFHYAIHALGNDQPHSLYRTRAEAYADLKTFGDPTLLEVRPYDPNAFDASNQATSIHSLDITPAMRTAALGGLPLFRQTGGHAGAVTSTTVTSAQEAHRARIDQIATAAMGVWKGQDKPRLEVVATPEQLPPSAKRGADGEPDATYKKAAGMYDGRTIYIVASAHRTDQAGMRKILKTMAHEGVGHYGVERIVTRELGAAAWSKIETATERLRNNPELASPAIREVLASLKSRYPGVDKQTFAREFLAVTAERGVKNGLLDRAIAAIRQWLRTVMPGLRLSEHELRQLLVASDEYLRVGESQQQRVQSRAALAFSADDALPQRDASTFAEARRQAQSFQSKPLANTETGLTARVSRNSLDKMLSSKAVGKSVSPAVQSLAVANLDNLFERATLGWSKPDKGGDTNIVAIHRFFAPLRVGDRMVLAKLTVKEMTDPNHRNPLYSVEAVDLNEERPAAQWVDAAADADGIDPTSIRSAGRLVTIAQGVQDFNSPTGSRFSQDDATGTPAFKRWFGDSKVVDASGDPMPVYHGTADDFDAFDPNRSGSATAHMTATLGTFFAEDQAKAQRYAENASQGVPADERVVDAYLSIQKPYVMGLKEFMAIDSQEEATALREKLKAEGFDGIQLKEFGQWVAFEPTQIKSASENRGTFDAGNPNIYFSRSADSVDALDKGQQVQQDTLVQRAKDWAAGKFEDLLPASLSLLQRRHLTELMAGQAPLRAAKQYDETVQALDADRAQLLAGAPDAAEHPDNMLKAGAAPVAEELRAFTHEKGVAGWFGRKSEQGKQLATVMHEATIQGVDPSKGYQRLQMKGPRGEWVDWSPKLVKERIAVLKEVMMGRSGDDKTPMMDEIKSLRSLKYREKKRQESYPALVAKYQALPEQGKALYQKMRDWYEQMSDATADALEARIMALRGDMEASEGKEIAERHTRMLVQKLRAEFEENKVTGVYFPLTRNGDYWVSYKDKAGDQGFQRFETSNDEKRFLKELAQKGGTTLATGRLDGNLKAADAPSGTFIAEVIGSLKKAGASEKAQDEVYQTFLRTLPEVSMRKHAIHRKATPGYSEDITRGFAQNAYHGAHQLARLRWAHRLQSLVDGMQKNVDAARKMAGADPQKIGRADALLGELKKRHDAIMSPNDTQVANTLNGIGFLYYMGASPASAIVNLTQNAQVTLPVLGAHHGWGKATRMLGAAMRDSMKTGGNIDRTLRDEELRAYNALRARGDIDKTQAHTMAGLAEGSLLQANPVYAKVMNGLTWMFHKAEVVNREAAGMAAYRLARLRGDDFNRAVQYASEIINGTHFDYSAANRPRIMQGNTARVALQFKNYSASMTWMLYRNLYQSFKGESAEVRSVARKTLTGILGMTSVFAGVMGLPIINVVRAVAGAAHAAAGDDDEPWDFNTEFRKWLAEHLGADVANWVADGAVNQVTGASIGSRVGMSDLWFRDEDRALEGKEAYYNYLEGLAGPMAGLAKNIFIGTDMIGEGHTWRGFETMLPKFAKDAMKATRYAHEGVNSLRGDPIMEDVSLGQDLMQGLGFQPTALREQQRINSALMNYTQAVRDRRTSLLNAYAMAFKEGDTDAARDVLAKMAKFSARWPEIAIRPGTIRDSLRQRAKLSAQSQNGIMLDKRIGGRIQQEVGATAGQ